MKHAKVRNSNDEIVEIRDYPEGYDPDAVLIGDGGAKDGQKKFGPPEEYRIIPVEKLPNETYDPTTEKLTQVKKVEPTRVTLQYVATPMSADEIKKAQMATDIGANKDTVESALAALKASKPLTTEQRRLVDIYVLSSLLRDE
jgi:hypothetical protein